MSNFYAGVDVGATTVKIGTFSDKGETDREVGDPNEKRRAGCPHPTGY